MRTIEVYIFHGIDEVVVACFKEDKCLKHLLVSKKELGEKLVERFELCLQEAEISLKDIKSIYLSNSFSTWNASRLVVFFVKNLATFSDIQFFLKQESLDKEDIDETIKNFSVVKKNFKFIEDPEQVEPLYKKCQNIDI